VCEDVARAQEEAAKACEDLALLLVHVKELKEDVALVSGQRDALNIQIGIASARIGILEDEVATSKRGTRLSRAPVRRLRRRGRRSVTRMRLSEHQRRHARSYAMRSWVGRPTLRVNLLSCFGLGLEVLGLC
jgi:hypothetical protein